KSWGEKAYKSLPAGDDQIARFHLRFRLSLSRSLHLFLLLITMIIGGDRRFLPQRNSKCLAQQPSTTTQEVISIGMPIVRPSSRSARPWLTAISTSPFEFSYQKAVPGGRSLNVLACSNTRPVATSFASCGNMTALSPVMALP